MQHQKIILAILLLTLSACSIGPNYVKPSAPIPNHYKEASKHWKIATPQDPDGPWWKIFHNEELNQLECQLTISNQNIAKATAQYFQARAIVDESRANFFPTLDASASITRQKTPASTTSTATSAKISTSHTLSFDASWEPDIWGSVRRTVEANVASAQASAASLAAVRLSSESLLAKTYFQLRTADNDQKILDDTSRDYKTIYNVIKNRYSAGIVAESDVIQAKTQWETAQAAAFSNGIVRQQFEHAIAVLIGKTPSELTLTKKYQTQIPPQIPVEIPSKLLERRPDIAQAERLMAQANAQVGVAITAYFPVLTLTGNASVTNPGFANWFSLPNMAWALGAQLSEQLIDGGLRSATVRAARANFDATTANYRQVVLSAFQNVEDNLVSVRLLNREAHVQDQAARDAHRALKIILNRYHEGVVDYNSVITAENTAFTADKTAADVYGQQMVAAVGLITALGGDW